MYNKRLNNSSAASWMGSIASQLRQLKLRNMVIPGSHDSATALLNMRQGLSPDSSVPSLVSMLLNCLDCTKKMIFDWSKAQALSVFEQLEAGIRYLDLRIVLRPADGRLYSCHGMYGQPVIEILREIRDFLDQNRKEIVLLDFQHLHHMTADSTQQFIQLLFELFDGKMAPVTAGTDVTVGDLWENAHQLIVFLNEKDIRHASDEFKNWLWVREATLESPWPKTTDIHTLETRLTAFDHARDKKRFSVLQGVLTPNGKMVVNSLLWPSGSHPKSLEDLAKIVNQHLLDWMRTEKFRNHNIFIVDHFHLHATHFMKMVISLNHKKAGMQVTGSHANLYQPQRAMEGHLKDAMKSVTSAAGMGFAKIKP